MTSRTQGQLLEFCGAALLESGDRDAAEGAFRELSRVAERTRDASNELQALSFEGALATLDGRLEDAVALGDRLIERAHALGMPQFAGLAQRGRTRALIYTGALQLTDVPALTNPLLRGFLLAHLGQQEEARDLLAILLPTYQTEKGGIDPLLYSPEVAALLEAALLLGDRQVVGLVAPLLAGCPGASPTGVPASYQRPVGAAYTLLREREKAMHHYRQAIESCTRMRFRPELALCRLELVELRLDEAISSEPSAISQEGGEAKLTADKLKAEGLDHLDFAIAEFRAMKMRPFLERALRQKGQLRA